MKQIQNEEGVAGSEQGSIRYKNHWLKFMTRFLLRGALATVLASSFSLSLFAQSTLLQVPHQTAPVVDGILSDGEWGNAALVEISIGGPAVVSVYVQHDDANLYFAFFGPLASTISFPEVMIDPSNDKTSDWGTEDWWFHVSGSDCESRGKPNDYSLCAENHDNWRGVPNFTQAFSPDTVEIVIALSKVNAGISFPDTIGVALDVTNTLSSWRYWPISATSSSPATWGTAILLPKKVSSVVEREMEGRRPERLDLR